VSTFSKPLTKVISIVRTQQAGGGTGDQDRLALAVALNTLAEARRAADNAAAARGRAIRMVDESEDRLAAATAGVTEAKAALARRMTLAAQDGTSLSPDSELRNARAEEQSCTDGLDAARAALAALESPGALEERLEAHALAERKVDELARVILARAIEPTISDIKRQRDALFASISVLHFLKNACTTSWPPNAEEARLRSHLQIPARSNVAFEIDYEAHRASSDRWAKYAEELKTSADAEPPGVPGQTI